MRKKDYKGNHFLTTEQLMSNLYTLIILKIIVLNKVSIILVNDFICNFVCCNFKKSQMSESIFIPLNQDKETIYKELFHQLKALIEGESDFIANMANTTAALKEVFGWWWVGFYLVKNNELVLGPFQGPIACTRISHGKGVCGTAWKDQHSILVPDVNDFPGHIACSSASISEIVVPLFNELNEVFAVLDIDSERYNILDETDVKWIEKISQLIKN